MLFIFEKFDHVNICYLAICCKIYMDVLGDVMLASPMTGGC